MFLPARQHHLLARMVSNGYIALLCMASLAVCTGMESGPKNVSQSAKQPNGCFYWSSPHDMISFYFEHFLSGNPISDVMPPQLSLPEGHEHLQKELSTMRDEDLSVPEKRTELRKKLLELNAVPRSKGAYPMWDCNHKHLIQVPYIKQQDATGMKKFELCGNSIGEIPDGYFENFNNLKSLLIEEPHLVNLFPNSFVGLYKLTHLTLNVPVLQPHLHAYIFHDLGSLTHLHISTSQPLTFEEDVFFGLANLKTLWMKNVEDMSAKSFKGLNKELRKLKIVHLVNYLDINALSLRTAIRVVNQPIFNHRGIF